MSRNVTLKDIARHTNLSVGAVSKALAGYPQVSKATRLRVQAASEELNYRPRHRPYGRARRFDATAERRIKFVLAEQWHTCTGHWLLAMAKASQRAGLRLEVSYLEQQGHTAENQTTRETWPQATRRLAGDIQGMLPFGCFDLAALQAMAALDIPCVVVGDMSLPRSDHALPVHWVSTDKIAMGQLATQIFIEQGHQHIAFFCGKQHQGGWNHQWHIGHRMALMNANFPSDPQLQAISHSQDAHKIAQAAAEQLTSLPTLPTAYVCPSIDVASAFKNALHDKNITLQPQQIAIGGSLEDARTYGLEACPLFDEPIEAMAIHSLNLMARLIDGESLPPAEILVPFTTHHMPPSNRLPV